MSRNRPATQHQLAELIRALSCPIDGEVLNLPAEFEDLLYECWLNVLFRLLPDRMIAGALIDEYQRPEREPSVESLQRLHLLETEAKGFLADIVGSRLDMVNERTDLPSPAQRTGYEADPSGQLALSRCGVWVDEEYKALCGWVKTFKALGPDAYDKHYASPAQLSPSDLLSESKRRRDVGVLLPSLTPDAQRYAYLEAMACLVEQHLGDASSDHPAQRVDALDAACRDVFSRGRRRFALEYPRTHRSMWWSMGRLAGLRRRPASRSLPQLPGGHSPTGHSRHTERAGLVSCGGGKMLLSRTRHAYTGPFSALMCVGA